MEPSTTLHSSTPPALLNDHPSYNLSFSSRDNLSIITLLVSGALAIISGIAILSLTAHCAWAEQTIFCLRSVAIGGTLLGCALIAIGLYKLQHHLTTIQPECAETTASSSFPSLQKLPTKEPIIDKSAACSSPLSTGQQPMIESLLASPVRSILSPSVVLTMPTPVLDTFAGQLNSISACKTYIRSAPSLSILESSTMKKFPPLVRKAAEHLYQKHLEAHQPELTVHQWFKSWAEVATAILLVRKSFLINVFFPIAISDKEFHESLSKLTEPLSMGKLAPTFEKLSGPLHAISKSVYLEALKQGEETLRTWVKEASIEIDNERFIENEGLRLYEEHEKFQLPNNCGGQRKNELRQIHDQLLTIPGSTMQEIPQNLFIEIEPNFPGTLNDHATSFEL